MIGVIGNEACDADSIVCAIAIALSRIDHIPFVNLDIDDIDCRLDFRAICKIANITDPVKQFKIHSIDEIETLGDTIEGWILVDHNDSFHTEIISPIIEVIDHHAIVSESVKIRLDSIPHVIESVGSCATLVARKIMVEHPNFITTDLGKIILKMLLLTIVLDTQNFSKSVGKATAEDLRVVDLICNHLGKEIVVDTQLMSEWFSEMSRAKFDPSFWYKAGNEEKILKYDFKRYELANGESIGMSVILRNIDDSIEQTAAVAMKRNFHKLYVVSGAYFVDNRQMVQILVIGHLPPAAIDRLIVTFSLALIRCSDSDRLLFQVNDPTFSRKKFAPVLLALCADS